jgi:hypothetical protein
MLVNHDSQRPALPRDAIPFQHGEEIPLFLSMVTSIGEGRKKVPHPCHSGMIDFSAGFEFLAQLFQESQDPQNHVMFFSKMSGWRFGLMMVVAWCHGVLLLNIAVSYPH